MKSTSKNIILASLIILIVSCSNRDKKDTTLSIQLIGTLDFRKSYAGVHALRSASFDLRAGVANQKIVVRVRHGNGDSVPFADIAQSVVLTGSTSISSSGPVE